MTIQNENLISRRGALIGFGALAVGFCSAGKPAFASGTADSDTLLSLLGDPAKAAIIGSAWMQQESRSLRPGAIMRDLTDSLHRQGWSSGTDAAELRAKYASAVQMDYRNGNLVKIQGWQIARTQAELCALAYFWANGLP